MKVPPLEARTCSIADCRPGDALALCPVRGDLLGTVISLGTLPWSLRHRFCHFGIVASYEGVPCVFESTHDAGLGPCLHAGVHVSGVQVHPLAKRLELHLDQRQGMVFRLPLLGGARLFSDVDNAFACECRRLLGTGYDARAAFGSRTLLGGAAFRTYDRFRSRPPTGHEDDFLFCSELVVKVYDVLGLLPTHYRGRRIEPGRFHPKAAARLVQDIGICGPPEEILL